MGNWFNQRSCKSNLVITTYLISKKIMVQPKYSPQEALERVKLMMKYDTSKTLNENKGIIKEQLSSCPNSISDDDIKKLAEDAGKSAFSLTALVKRMFSGDENAKVVLNAIKQVVGKNTWDEVDEKCIPAKDVFDKYFKKNTESWLGLTGGSSVSEKLNEIVNDSYVKKTFPEAIRIITKAKSLWDAPSPSTTTNVPTTSGGTGNTGGVKGNTGGGKGNSGGGFKLCKGIYSFGCKTDPSGAIGQVQSCLGGLVVDGKYGTNTNNKLKEIGYNSFKDEDIQKICNKQKQPDTSKEAPKEVPKDDIVQVDSEDAVDLLK